MVKERPEADRSYFGSPLLGYERPHPREMRERLVIETVAHIVASLTGLYLVVLGTIALLFPNVTGKFLLGFAKTPARHYIELFTRLIVGASLVTSAKSVSYPLSFNIFGWLLVVTTLLMAFMPWKTHDRIARHSVLKALPYLPLIGIISLLLGGLIMICMWQAY